MVPGQEPNFGCQWLKSPRRPFFLSGLKVDSEVEKKLFKYMYLGAKKS